MKEKSVKETEVKKPVKVRKKTQRTVPVGIAHVLASFNNTIVTITDLAGHVIAWCSAGKAGYSGSRKSSAFAATVAAQEAAKAAMALGMKEVEINLKGPGAGRESAVRGLQSSGLNITIIRDVTPVPHNGCRARKRRRV
ncbi:MAG TPA: 30S ribosomal protein S11 [Rhabdochlamydiaceae bacterium]|jgi:small subunit ribosomal protein S11|nr:30S ribosomal protein S11 [Rhabdochlamydiaceae bacterium]